MPVQTIRICADDAQPITANETASKGINDRGYDCAGRLDFRQHGLACFGQHRLIRPRRVGDNCSSGWCFGAVRWGPGSRPVQ
jgi:hypothetical protein